METQSISIVAKKEIAVISLSGGLDSTSLLLHLLAQGIEVYAVSFDYGQKHRIELSKLQDNIQYLESMGYSVTWHILPMHYIGQLFSSSLLEGGDSIPEGHYGEENMKQTVVPNRNAIFSSIVYGYGLSLAMKNLLDKPVKICLGVHAGDHDIYPDCRPEFYQRLHEVFREGNWDGDKVEFYTPFLYMNKAQVLQQGIFSCLNMEIDSDIVFKNTNTCYNPDEFGRSCGKCGSCVERVEAFILNNKVDPIAYIESWEKVVESVKLILSSKK